MGRPAKRSLDEVINAYCSGDLVSTGIDGNYDVIGERVLTMSMMGLSPRGISNILGLPLDVLKEKYSYEMVVARDLATERIASSLFKKAADGDTKAQIFWLKSQSGWREDAGGKVDSSNNAPKIIDDIEDVEFEDLSSDKSKG